MAILEGRNKERTKHTMLLSSKIRDPHLTRLQTTTTTTTTRRTKKKISLPSNLLLFFYQKSSGKNHFFSYTIKNKQKGTCNQIHPKKIHDFFLFHLFLTMRII